MLDVETETRLMNRVMAAIEDCGLVVDDRGALITALGGLLRLADKPEQAPKPADKPVGGPTKFHAGYYTVADGPCTQG